MKRNFLLLVAMTILLLFANKVFAGCAPGETFVEVQITADPFMIGDNTDFEVVIGGVVVYTNSVDGPVPNGPFGGPPSPINAVTIVSGCYAEGATIEINLLNDDLNDGWLGVTPVLLILGCDQVIDGNEPAGTWTMPGNMGNIYTGTLPTDNDGIGAINPTNGTGAALPQCAANADWTVQPTSADVTAAGATLAGVAFPAGYTEQPFCDVAGGDNNGALSGVFTDGFTEEFEVCAEWTQPNVTGSETGALIGLGTGSVELLSFEDVDGNGGINDCGGGVSAVDVYDSAGVLVSSGTSNVTGLTPGDTYCMCITAFVSDTDLAGPDNMVGTADDGSSPADGTCVLDGFYGTIAPYDLAPACEEYNAQYHYQQDVMYLIYV